MKRILLLLVLIITNSFVFSQDFTVKLFTADITLHSEGYFDVVESYDVNFSVPKHGLLRNIINKYDFKDDNGTLSNRQIDISNIEVPGHKFSRAPKLFEKLSGAIELKIGSSNQLVTGDQHYEIRYRVNNALINTDSLAQFYWNIKPNGWHADFKKIEFKIHMPKGVILSAENCFTYSGVTGNEEISKDFEYKYGDGTYSAVSNENFNSSMGENVTALIKFPKNIIIIPKPPSFLEKNKNWIGILSGILVLFGLLWLKYGKDKKVVSITSYYPPKGIDPALAAYLMHDKLDKYNLISLIPKWGAEGLIKLKEIPKSGFLESDDLIITQIGTLAPNVPIYEKTMFDGIFGGLAMVMNLSEILEKIVFQNQTESKTASFTTSSYNIQDIGGTQELDPKSIKMSSLKNVFYLNMNLAEEQLKKTALQYYEISGEKARLIAITVSIILAIALPLLFANFYGLIAAISGFVIALILVILSFTMRKKNPKGDQAFSELKGFYEFVKLADVNRIKVLIERDPSYFEKTMSYALAFGFLKKWASKFDSLNMKPPEWYRSSNLSNASMPLTMTHFTQHFTNSMSMASSNMVSAPSSSSSSGSGSSSSSFSGGGSSGGGFGGGGGGSW
ncbi:MAG TPA: DUF2207 domain-containing protein [Edaphocola sp.]|nr:DUF2207 domain-containing protein [Edaphocola sp.]